MRTTDPTLHEEKRQEILAAAGACFARSGFQGATIAAICAEAKISPGHLYHYFASKEAIVRAMAEANLASIGRGFDELAKESDAVTALIDGIRRAERLGERAGRGLHMDLLTEAGRNPDIAAILRDHSRALRDHLADFLRAGQTRGQVDPTLDAEMAAAILLSVMDGARTLMIRDPDQDMKQCITLLQTLIARFLKPQG